VPVNNKTLTIFWSTLSWQFQRVRQLLRNLTNNLNIQPSDKFANITPETKKEDAGDSKRTTRWPRVMGAIRAFTFESDLFSVPCHEIVVEGRTIRYVDATRLSYARLTSLFDKEPTTIPWLESFQSNETLVDIGANIGMYTIYAAAFAGCRVFAFEPESLNYAELNKNIFVNNLHERVSAFPIALSNEVKVDYLNLGAFGVAYSHHDFSENTWKEDMKWDDKLTRKDARLRQGCVSSTLDALVETGLLPVPDHIKIDVDGLEHRVIAGCRKTLTNPAVKTVLVEIDFRSVHADATIDFMTDLGWKYSMDQLRTNRSFILPTELVQELRAKKRDGLNYIFFRDEKYAHLFKNFLADYTPPWPLPKK
jgi:FkbM family methyltransferase